MEITGVIIEAMPARGGISATTGKEWKSQDFVIETFEQEHPERLVFSVFGDRLDEFNIQKGLTYTVFVSFHAKEYNGRYFNNVNAWRVELQSKQVEPTSPSFPAQNHPSPSQPVQNTPQSAAYASAAVEVQGDNANGDLPF